MYIKITDTLDTTRRWAARLTSPVVNMERLRGFKFRADDMKELDELKAFTDPGRELMGHLGLFEGVTVHFDPEDACRIELEPDDQIDLVAARRAFCGHMENFIGSWTVKSGTTTGIDWK